MSFQHTVRKPKKLPEATNLLRRQCVCGRHSHGTLCPACREKKFPGPSQEAGQRGRPLAPPLVHEVLRESGKPLEPGLRSVMETHFGQDFTRVRIHTGARAAASASLVSALAYTVGPQVVFNAGQYRPETEAGRTLLKHELAHVVQQANNSLPPAKLEIGAANSPLENKATQIATETVQRQPRTLFASVAAPVLQRQPEDPQAPLPYREAMEETERGLFEEYQRACVGIRILRRLEREPPTPLERVRGLETRLRVLPKLFELQREINSMEDPRARENARREFRESVIEGPFPKFPPGYALLSEEEELARARCELSEARWEFIVAQRGGRLPGRLLRRP